MGQKFYASKRDTLACANGAIGFRTGGPFDCLGPFAKVKNCPIAGYPGVRLTAYASGYTFDSVADIPFPYTVWRAGLPPVTLIGTPCATFSDVCAMWGK